MLVCVCVIQPTYPHPHSFTLPLSLSLSVQYFKSFASQDEALEEATVTNAEGQRQCRPGGGDKFLFLANVSLDDISEQKLLQFVNIGKFPRIAIKPRATADSLTGHSISGDAKTTFLDHFRVQSEFFFFAALRKYPFQTQTLRVILGQPPHLRPSRRSARLVTSSMHVRRNDFRHGPAAPLVSLVLP